MSDEPNSSNSNKGTWVTILLGVLVLYAVSSGPAVYLCARYESLEGVDRVSRIYAPLICLEEKTVLKGPIDAYLDWWVDLAGSKPRALSE